MCEKERRYSPGRGVALMGGRGSEASVTSAHDVELHNVSTAKKTPRYYRAVNYSPAWGSVSFTAHFVGSRSSGRVYLEQANDLLAFFLSTLPL